MERRKDTGGARLANRALPVIDFHSHILPKMDDGSKSVEMSLQMLDMMAEGGTKLVFATPHFYGHKESPERFLQRREHAWETLAKQMNRGQPKVGLGAEIAFYSGLTQLDDATLDALCLEGTNILLIEMPFARWSGYELDVLSSLTLDRGYRVLLAHFERFESFGIDGELWERILALPVQLQMNAETLLSWKNRKKWLPYFESDCLPVLGSDSHNLDKRSPNLHLARKVLAKKLGEDVLSQIDRRGIRFLHEMY